MNKLYKLTIISLNILKSEIISPIKLNLSINDIKQTPVRIESLYTMLNKTYFFKPLNDCIKIEICVNKSTLFFFTTIVSIK